MRGPADPRDRDPDGPAVSGVRSRPAVGRGHVQAWMLVIGVAAAAGLAACGGGGAPEVPGRSAAGVLAPVADGTGRAGTLDPFAFTVEVTLSDEAAALLAASGETVVVGATFFGDPAEDAGDALINDVGQIDLGRREVEISGAGTAAFGGTDLRLDRLDAVAGEPQVNVNVYSGRRSAEDNLLDCGFFQDAVEVAARAPVVLACRLLSEGGDGGS